MNRFERFLAALAIATSPPLLSAQTAVQLREMPRQHFPADGFYAREMVQGDLDLDGDVDLVAANLYGTSGQFTGAVYRNVAGGVFLKASVLTLKGNGLALGDVDGDTDLDLASSGTPTLLLRNDGLGNFSSYSSLPGCSQILRFGDVDGDGDLDLVSACTSISLWLNNGAGLFVDATAGRMPLPPGPLTGVVLGDLDGDRDLDLATSSMPFFSQPYSTPAKGAIFINDGTGTFSDRSANWIYPPWDYGVDIHASDIDLDADLDLVVGNYSKETAVYLNDGTAKFVDGTAGRMPAGTPLTAKIVPFDADRDGDPDIAQVDDRGRLFLNDGTGRFTDATSTRMPNNLGGGFHALAADVDGDRDGDLVLGWVGQVRLLLNDGRGVFADATSYPLARLGPSLRFALCDVDADLDLDLITAAQLGPSRLHLLSNDGTGVFSGPVAGVMPVDPGSVASIGPADVDQDGDADLLFSDGALHVYLNSGIGTFTDATANLPGGNVDVFAVGDVDRDGDPDLVLGVRYAQNRLWLNDGTGRFADATSGRMPPDTDATSGLILFDPDRDGDLDLALGQADWSRGFNQDKLYLNDGSGSFTDVSSSRMPPNVQPTSAVTQGDIDGDGDPDLVFTGYSGGSAGVGPRVYLNDGRGGFRLAPPGSLPTIKTTGYDVELWDVDEDGDLDLLLADYPKGDTLLVNDGSGTFSTGNSRLPPNGPPPGAVLGSYQYEIGDVDLDGDEDLIAPLQLQADGKLLANLHRQIHAPYLARLGAPYVVDIYSQPGYATNDHVALPMLSLARAANVVPPFGLFGLDPTQTILLLPVLIPGARGSGSVVLQIPNDPRLAQLPVHFQALVFPSTNVTAARFTQVMTETIRAL